MIQMILKIRGYATQIFDTSYETTREARREVSDHLESGARFMSLEDTIVATEDITLIEFVEFDDE